MQLVLMHLGESENPWLELNKGQSREAPSFWWSLEMDAQGWTNENLEEGW